MRSALFCCPICAGVLYAEEGRYVCTERHSYDIARKGYVNLFRGKPGNQHGDNRAMIEGRRDFLDAGYYADLADTVASLAASYAPPFARVLDAGCGECYYTDLAERALAEHGTGHEIVGIDISREALALGARRNSNIALAVASVYHLPFAAATFDLLLSIFSPYAGEEFLRVLRPNGHLLMVIPRERHLFGLKEVLYDRPYENSPSDTALDGFTLIEERRVEKVLHLAEPAAIQNLFRMTPYYYRTSATGQERLAACATLDTEIAFSVFVYQKD